MDALSGVFLIIVGLATMGLGLFLFYAMLPVFYTLFGLGVGYELGSFLTDTPAGEFGLVKVILAIVGGIAFGAAAYFLEPFRRILIGVGLGSLLGGLVANALGLTGFLGVVLMVIGAVIGAGLMIRVFDMFIVVASALGGAGLLIDGADLLFQETGIFDRTAIASGAIWPLIIWIVSGAVAIGWQVKNIEKWTRKNRQSK